MDLKKFFNHDEKNGLIKTTVPLRIDSAQKAALNRKGNVLFNSGDIEGARKIFLSTGYSDGISRVGDYYKSKNRLIDALRMYWIAHNKTKYEPLLMQLAGIVQNLIHLKDDSAGGKRDA